MDDIDTSTYFAISSFYPLTALASHVPCHEGPAARCLEELWVPDFALGRILSVPLLGRFPDVAYTHPFALWGAHGFVNAQNQARRFRRTINRVHLD